MKRLITIFCILFLLVSCNVRDKLPQQTAQNVKDTFSTVRIGTFNIEWLGDGVRDRIDRTSADYRAIAMIIQENDVDLLGLQEIENQAALDSVLKYLPPEYTGFVGTRSSQQNLGVIYRSDKVDLRFVSVYYPLAIREGRDRPGLIVRCRSKNFDWLLMIVHLKSTSRWDNTPAKRRLSQKIRQQQAQRIVEWAKEVLSQGDERDLIIVGDFNASPKDGRDRTLLPIKQDTTLQFLTYNLQSCKYKKRGGIDHILVSREAKKRYIPGSARSIDLYSQFTPDALETISDHCPVIADFEVLSPDTDPVQFSSR